MPRLDVQAAVRAALESSLPGVEVRVSVPDPRPARLVVVTREGGARRDGLIDAAGIGVSVWAPTEAEASALASDASDAMASLPFARGFARVTETAYRSDYDRAALSPRWYASYTVLAYRPTEEE